MYTYFHVNNSESELTGKYTSPEKVCRLEKAAPNLEIAESTLFINKSYTFSKEEITEIFSTNYNTVTSCETKVGSIKTRTEYGHYLWDDYKEAQLIDNHFQEKLLDSTRKLFTTLFDSVWENIYTSGIYKDDFERTYLSTTGDEFIFWHDGFSIVYDLSCFNSQLSNILLQKFGDVTQQQYGPSKGWYLDVTRTRHSKAKRAYFLSQFLPLLLSGLNSILGGAQSLIRFVRTHRDTLGTYLQESIEKYSLKFKNGIRSVEVNQIGDKEKSDSKGQRLGIYQTAYSGFFVRSRSGIEGA